MFKSRLQEALSSFLLAVGDERDDGRISASWTSPTTSGTRTTSSETTTSISTSPSSGDLTTSAKVGISVGVGVGAIGAIALLIALCFFKRRKQRAPAELPAPEPRQPPMYQAVWQPAPVAELPATKARPGHGSMGPTELGG